MMMPTTTTTAIRGGNVVENDDDGGGGEEGGGGGGQRQRQRRSPRQQQHEQEQRQQRECCGGGGSESLPERTNGRVSSNGNNNRRRDRRAAALVGLVGALAAFALCSSSRRLRPVSQQVLSRIRYRQIAATASTSTTTSTATTTPTTASFPSSSASSPALLFNRNYGGDDGDGDFTFTSPSSSATSNDDDDDDDFTFGSPAASSDDDDDDGHQPAVFERAAEEEGTSRNATQNHDSRDGGSSSTERETTNSAATRQEQQQQPSPQQQQPIFSSEVSRPSSSSRRRPLPPLDELVAPENSATTGTGTIDEDLILSKKGVKNLLDVAILGHAKCATSFVLKWLRTSPEIAMFKQEVCDVYDGKPASLARKLYGLSNSTDAKRGFKCPGHFARTSLRWFRKYYGNARLIVGVRHPVLWFESYYNFRSRHMRGSSNNNATRQKALPPADALIGECTPEGQGVCTDRANFQRNFGNFGKTPMNTTAEMRLLRIPREKQQYLSEIPNPIFVYDTSQIYQEQFRIDLQRFVGLDAELVAAANVSDSSSSSSSQKKQVLDICLPRYRNLRRELVDIGTRASSWMREYFLKMPSVYVSNRTQFESILETWQFDPCEGKRGNDEDVDEEVAAEEGDRANTIVINEENTASTARS